MQRGSQQENALCGPPVCHLMVRPTIPELTSMPNMPDGPRFLVLRACDDLPKDSYGFVLDAAIADRTQLRIEVVRDCFVSLEKEKYLSLVRKDTPDRLAAIVTEEGRVALSQSKPFAPNEDGHQGVQKPIKIVPKGLRSFDEGDKDFFLELLPSPRRADGLPESVRFWKVRIERAEATFQVGVIYGPSGCGKSSLAKAGVLPKLSDLVRHVYVEATGDRTESECLTGIRRRYSDLSPTLGLVDSLATLKYRTASHSGEKILLVLDQFEQWLLEHRGEPDTELVRALRHCDGKSLQAVLMVREDFLAATIRFMKEIGVEFRPDHNACEVEMFGKRHAERVLTAFGRAEEILRDELTAEQQRFITQAVNALARSGGLVIPVRLAIFFQTVKNLDWNSKTLRKFGDAEGVGTAFLEKTFNDEYANRRHRDHQEAAQSVLGALLPESGRELKRPSRARRELLELSGYSSQPDRFDDLVRILDEELRLITAIDQDETVVAGSPRPTSGEPFYQLTHDFLVPSLREWRGHKDHEALQLVETIWMAETRDVPRLVNGLATLRFWANPLLHRILETSGVDSKERLHASLALLPVDKEQVEYLYRRLLKADPPEFSVIRDALKPYQEGLVERLWNVLEQPGSAEGGQQLQAASASALYDPSDPRWLKVGGGVAQALVTVNTVHLGTWLEALRPVRDKLTAPLATIYRDTGRPETERNLAIGVLGDYTSDQPDVLAKVLMDSQEDHFAGLFDKLKAHRETVVPLLRGEMDKSLPEATEVEEDDLAKRQARAAIALVRLGRAVEVWPKLQHSPDPRLRSFIVNWLAPLGVNPLEIAAELERIVPVPTPTPAEGQQAMDAVLFNPENSKRRALILSLGQYGMDCLSAGERDALITKLIDVYCTDPDAGVHGATEWTLLRWGQEKKVSAISQELRRPEVPKNQRWLVNTQGQTIVVIDGPVKFQMGSPQGDDESKGPEVLHTRIIPRSFALAAKTVTFEQYEAFLQCCPEMTKLEGHKDNPHLAGPIVRPTWYEAAAYCNWLSERENVPKDQWCFKPNKAGRFEHGTRICRDVLFRHGYRLPTEAEWEFACRSGTVTRRYYGHSAELLDNYAVWQSNSRDCAWIGGKLQPNDLGLFDMLGNVSEWCLNSYENISMETLKPKYDNCCNENVWDKSERIIRGGSFRHRKQAVRSASRIWKRPNERDTGVGFRIARTLLRN
jgi:formylglycine-generating enzyme required for sulfatase activity